MEKQLKRKCTSHSVITMTEITHVSGKVEYQIVAESDYLSFRFWKKFSDEMMKGEWWWRIRFWVWMIEAIPIEPMVHLAFWSLKK